jgi:hypothetical protein
VNPFDYTFFFNRKLISVNPESPVSLSTNFIFNNITHSTRNSCNSKLALNNILSNLITAHLNGRYLVVPKTPNEFSGYTWYGLSHYTYRLIVGWIERLISEGYIHQLKGFYDTERNSGKRTRLWIDEKLISTIEEFRNYGEEFLSTGYKRPIILKDRSIKKMLFGTILQVRFLIRLNS